MPPRKKTTLESPRISTPVPPGSARREAEQAAARGPGKPAAPGQVRIRRRRRNASPDTFTTGEIASATGLPLRSVIHLCEIGLLPATGGQGRGAKRELNIEALGRIAIIAALHRAGVPIVTGARLVEALTYEPDVGVVMGSLQHLMIEPHPPYRDRLPFDVEVAEEHDLHNPFWQHHYLSHYSAIYKKNTSFTYDCLIEIVDCRSAFYSVLIDLDEILRPSPHVQGMMTEIENWGTKQVTATNLPINSLSIEGANLIRQQFRGLIVANLSLMMRDILDAIQEYRQITE